MIPWSPLARGRLTRPWDTETARTETDEFGGTLYRDEDRAIVETVLAVAERRGVPPAQVALAWLLAQPAVTSPIVGVTKPEHLDDAVAAVDLELGDDEVEELGAGYVPHADRGPPLRGVQPSEFLVTARSHSAIVRLVYRAS